MDYIQKLDAADDPNTPQETLQLLATDKDDYARYRVALNSNTSIQILQQLATDKRYSVRCYTTKHPNSNQIIERLVFMTNYQQNQ
jgi:hypothetical protein